MKKERIDKILVLKGFVETRNKAQALIMAGQVFLDKECSKRVLKPSELYFENLEVHIKQKLPYVSRAGMKLKAAVDKWKISFLNKTVLDVGASTGGFTDCALQEGARIVYALDVGKNLIDSKLRNDIRVKLVEKCNFRYATPDIFPDIIELSTVDVSFISLKLILPPLYKVLKKYGEAIVLIKPQFELGPSATVKGVVKDINLRDQIKNEIVEFAKQIKFQVKDVMESPVKGASGNVEYLMLLIKH